MKTIMEQNNLGQGVVEYAMILGLVVIIVVIVVAVLGPQVSNMYGQVTGGFPG